MWHYFYLCNFTFANIHILSNNKGTWSSTFNQIPYFFNIYLIIYIINNFQELDNLEFTIYLISNFTSYVAVSREPGTAFIIPLLIRYVPASSSPYSHSQSTSHFTASFIGMFQASSVQAISFSCKRYSTSFHSPSSYFDNE